MKYVKILFSVWAVVCLSSCLEDEKTEILPRSSKLQQLTLTEQIDTDAGNVTRTDESYERIIGYTLIY